MSKRIKRLVHVSADVYLCLTRSPLTTSAIAALAIDLGCQNPDNLAKALSVRLKRNEQQEQVRTTVNGPVSLFDQARELGAVADLAMEQVLRLAIEAWLIHQGIINEFTGNLRIPRDRGDNP